MTDKINFCIGAYWDKEKKESIGCYMIHGNDVFYATPESANNTLEYVKKQSPDKDWRIFIVTEYNDGVR